MNISKINKKWNAHQKIDMYSTTLQNLNSVKIDTTLNNVYIFRRHCVNNYSDLLETLWSYTKNDVDQYVTNEVGAIIEPKELDLKDFSSLDVLLTFFYDNINPETLMPIEVPTNVVIK